MAEPSFVVSVLWLESGKAGMEKLARYLLKAADFLLRVF